MARHDKNTYIACRPGMQSTMQQQFAGMHVEVDNTITSPTGYEFRKKELSALELMEEEVRTSALQEADPKNATTVIVPLVLSATEFDSVPADQFHYAVVRVQNDYSSLGLQGILAKVDPFTVFDDNFDEAIDEALTISNIKDALQDAGVNVLSISLADFAWLKEA